MNVKGWKDFSDRDREELTKMLEAMQKLKSPRLTEERPDELYYDLYSFFLGRGKQFKITRIR